MKQFFIGLHIVSHAKHFDHPCISVNRLRTRRKKVECKEILLDSGAFTELSIYGRYRHSPKDYAKTINRLVGDEIVTVKAAVAQDYMCEPFMLKKTGLKVKDHQRLTIERYDELLAERLPVYIMPVIQGYTPEEYAEHVEMYGDRLAIGAWVGVGSVCKRQGNPWAIWEILNAINSKRPDLSKHGFGVKHSSLKHWAIWDALDTADSMAWSFAERMSGGNANCWRAAKRFNDSICKSKPGDSQMYLLLTDEA